MSLAGKKRSRAPVAGHVKISKRQKSGSTGGGKHNKTSASTAKVPTRIDALPWKAFSMPDKLDDYEGFFGLEEVDDVDILRDNATGEVQYVSKPSNTAKQIGLSEGGSDDNEGHDAIDGSVDAEEWNGFENDDQPEPEPALKVGKERQPEKKTKEKSKKKQKSEPSSQQSSNQAANAAASKSKSHDASAAFSHLQNSEKDDGVDVSAWKSFKLSPDTMAALSKLKFAKPSAIQTVAIPEILNLHDVIGKAPTGSGKTLAFGIPILERYLELRATRSRGSQEAEEKAPLALILSPTRELAHQLDKHLTALCSNGLFEGPSIATLTGGLSLHKQQRLLKFADIVIGTPGRLWEVASGGQGVMKALKQIQFLVVDEADRLLSEGHFKEVEEILNALERIEEDVDIGEEPTMESNGGKSSKTERQTLVFSATFDRSLQTKLATRQKISRADNNILSNHESMEYLLSKLPFREEQPKFIDVNPVNQLATGLREGLVECGAMEKDLYLYTVLLLNSTIRTIVFTNSISAVRRITPFLQNLDIPALALHSGMAQKARLRSVERFTQTSQEQSANGRGSVLVATDVAARGLDIPKVQLVLHYHLPRAADTYVHRSGRTARAGEPGSSVLLCGPEEVVGVRRLVAKVHAQSALSSTSQQNGGSGVSEAKKQGYYIRTLDLDRRLVSRLKPRAKLAKQIADATTAKEKQSRQDDFFRTAAEELGVEYDSEEMDKADTGKRGRGAGRKKKEREARGMTKAEVGALEAELKGLLRERVNVGVSERYLTGGNVDVDELLRQKEAGLGKTGEFLGRIDGVMGLEDL